MIDRKMLKTDIVTCALCFLPMVIGLIFYDKMPDIVATHFNLNNEPDGWMSKAFAVFAMPFIFLAIQIFLCVVMELDKSSAEAVKVNIRHFVRWIIPVIGVIAQVVTIAYAMGKRWDIGGIMMALLGVFFSVMGNYFPKFKRNFVIGIRIPSTLADDENWRLTHRMAGWIWVPGGAVVFVCGIAGWYIPAIAVFAVLVTAPIIYSLVIAKKRRAG